MADLNKVTLQGRFVRDPESKVAKSGTEFVTFCLACNRIPSKDTGEITADFVDFVAYGNTAKFIKQFFRKGNQAIAEGSIRTNMFIDKDENKRKSTEVVCDKMYFCGAKTERNEEAPVPEAQSNFEAASNEDDLPF